MVQPYTAPSYLKTAFNCAFCGAFAKQDWGTLNLAYAGSRVVDPIPNATGCHCTHCQRYSFWQEARCVFPLSGSALLPNADMPDDVKADYEEARSIAAISPRGAAALLRLSIQKLCKHLGEPGKDINADIASLVKKGLPEVMQQALDSVRVVGNSAVHPGQINFADNSDAANGLFGIVNFICENRITQPKMISQFYTSTVPVDTQGHIAQRDSKGPRRPNS